jgi:pSer/pThr/pTyr-binding forkhead associated (FHA) protein
MTRLESDDEVRQALLARKQRLGGKAAPASGQPAAAPVESDTQPERPVQRPPMALLCILDDGKHDGEWIRLRADRTVLGRTEGDVRIPHDLMMSARHAEIVRHKVQSGYRWHLTDLQSTNGTFVRIGSTILRHGNELLIGAGRYRFEAASAPATELHPAPVPPQGTLGWQGESLSALVPCLVELTPSGPGRRFPLSLPEYWIGRDANACAIARPEDPLTNPRHAWLYRDAKGQWHVENNKSLNGLWLRVEQIPLEGACQFRLGEQRFLLRVL